jgi:predicted nucleic acid-binding Zn ribbon protein
MSGRRRQSPRFAKRRRAKKPKRTAERRHVADVLSELFGRRHMTEEVQLSWARKVWPEICGEAARYSRPHSVKKKALRVVVSDSVWLQELSMQRHALLAALQRALPAEMSLEELKFFVGDPRRSGRSGCGAAR